ncbi:MAG: hypothetical protein EA382_02735 [Spirochaetaceae bacterium]|nr:MAG: hypothetical protein EA382_02735 [Spirochaetaceae bacterium]
MTGVRDEQELLLTRFLRVLSCIGVVAYIPGVWIALDEGIVLIAIANTVTYALVLAVAWIPGVRAGVKLTVVIATALALSAILLVTVGPRGAGYIWMIAAGVIAAVFGSHRAIVITLLATVALLAGYGVAIAFGLEGHGNQPVTVVIIGTNVIVVALALAIVVRAILDRLERSVNSQKTLAERLRIELDASTRVQKQLGTTVALKDELLREVHHRVNNNMQLILSMIDLDDTARSDARSVYARIRVLSAINNLLHTDRNALRIGLIDIAATVYDLAFDRDRKRHRLVYDSPPETDREPRVPVELSAQEAVPIALYLFEIAMVVESDTDRSTTHYGMDDGGEYVRLVVPESRGSLIPERLAALNRTAAAIAANDLASLRVEQTDDSQVVEVRPTGPHRPGSRTE